MCHEAIERESDLNAFVESSGVPLLMYCGTEDPYRDVMSQVAAKAEARFVSVAGADHYKTTLAATTILPQVAPFLLKTLHDS